ncbi:hypothetical protein [Dapis sp. BLCC M229]|uniref:hypothetical protein n=1 Tax=Dapis sp. BLCC M229 TaxID=3400188 RepID=UPI003CED83F2
MIRKNISTKFSISFLIGILVLISTGWYFKHHKNTAEFLPTPEAVPTPEALKEVGVGKILSESSPITSQSPASQAEPIPDMPGISPRQTPRLGADELSKIALKRAFDNLSSGFVRLNKPPEKMKVGDTEEVKLRISRNLESNLSEYLESNSDTAEIMISHFMKATLKSEGEHIEVKPLYPVDGKQALPEAGSAEWVWSVTAKEAGEDITLYLVVYARFNTDNQSQESFQLKTYELDIDVTVEPYAFWKKNWKWIIENMDKIGLVGTGTVFLSQSKKFLNKLEKSHRPVDVATNNNKASDQK